MKPTAPEPTLATPSDRIVYICDAHRHLVCQPYSVEGLHQMARDLGIHRGWFHGGKHPHYDIPKKREAEIKARCRVVSSRDILAIIYGNTTGN
jgi:hypothetical protein